MKKAMTPVKKVAAKKVTTKTKMAPKKGMASKKMY
jgi:hypothetical protein